MNRWIPLHTAVPSVPRPAGVGAVVLVVVLAGVALGPVALTDGTADGQTAGLNESEQSDQTAVERATDRPTDGPEAVVEAVSVTDDTTVTVTFSTDANGTRQFTATGVEAAMVDADEDWAYLPRSALPARLERVAGDHTAGVGVVGRWALVGDLAVASAHEGRARVTVVAPAGMDVDPGRKAGFLARYLSSYALRPGSADPVTLYIAPDALPSDGRMYDDTGYVTQHAFWDGDAGSVWVHEYVHAHQAFALEPEMRWFREASATYLSYRVMEEQYGPVTDADVRARVTASPDYSGTALANYSAWDGPHAAYDRGARLLYAVDAAVRSGSGGEHTLVDVVRAMNERRAPVSVAEFVRIVERHAGGPEEWLRTAITEPGDLDGRVRNASSAFDDS